MEFKLKKIKNQFFVYLRNLVPVRLLPPPVPFNCLDNNSSRSEVAWKWLLETFVIFLLSLLDVLCPFKKDNDLLTIAVGFEPETESLLV